MARCKPFVPAFWLKNPHLQTLWPFLFRYKPKPTYQRKRLELPDGDFLDLDTIQSDSRISSKGTILLIHGLQGSSNSHYIRGIGQSLSDAGYKVIAFNQRNQSGETNRLPIFGHAGFIDDIDYVINFIRQSEKPSKLHTVAFSLGASMMLNWLFEDKIKIVDSAIAISVPYLLSDCANRMEKGFSRVYQYHLISSLKKTIKNKLKHMTLPNLLENWSNSKTFYQFDDAVTARLHGFKDAHDYYSTSSTKNKLKNIQTPLLLIQSTDDPFMSENVIPSNTQINPNTTLEVYPSGGHVGFVESKGFTPSYWLDKRIVDFLEHCE